jgi:hypothetical protein
MWVLCLNTPRIPRLLIDCGPAHRVTGHGSGCLSAVQGQLQEPLCPAAHVEFKQRAVLALCVEAMSMTASSCIARITYNGSEHSMAVEKPL